MTVAFTKAIIPPLFSKLVILNLNQCHVENLEFMTFMNAPKLSILGISFLHVFGLKPLSKINLPSLHKMKLLDLKSPALFFDRIRIKKT
jgi:hypothetical protein